MTEQPEYIERKDPNTGNLLRFPATMTEQEINEAMPKAPQFIEKTHMGTGDVIKFPVTMSEDEMQEALDNYSIRQIPQGGQATNKGPSWLTRNMDVPTSIAGGIAGSIYGSRFGPMGTLTGGVIGGGVGTFAGSAYSSNAIDGDVDYEKAVFDSMLGMGIDVGTGLVGKYVPDAVWLRAMKKLGFSPEQTAESIVAKAGTPESLKQTQTFLAERGLSLTPYQTGAANGFRIIQERLANVGIFSRGLMQEHYGKVQGAIREEFDKVFNTKDQMGLNDLGSYMAGVVEAGQEGLSIYYDKTLDDVLKNINISYTSAAPLKARISKIASENNIYGLKVDKETGELVETAIDNKLPDDVRSFLGETFNKFEDVTAIDAKAIIALEKKISQKQKQLKEAGSFDASKELMRIGEDLKSTYADMLKNIDPVQGERYLKLKDTYKQAINNLVPTINKETMEKALRSQDYTSLGRLMVESGTVTQMRKFMTTIDQSYALARKNGTLEQLPFKTPAEAKKQLRKTFLTHTFPDLLDESVDLSKLLTKIRKYTSGDNAVKMKTLFGPDYKQVNKLFNAIQNTSKTPKGDIGSLMFRNKEYGALGNLLTAVTAGGLSGVSGSSGGTLGTTLATLGGAGFVLYTPVVMAKAITNPKLATKILNLSKGKFASDKAAYIATGMVVNDVIKAMDDGELAEFRDVIEGFLDDQSKQRERLLDEQKTQLQMGGF